MPFVAVNAGAEEKRLLVEYLRQAIVAIVLSATMYSVTITTTTTHACTSTHARVRTHEYARMHEYARTSTHARVRTHEYAFDKKNEIASNFQYK